MSLTGPNGLFAAVHEDGINDFIQAFFGARPRLLSYGSQFFVPATTVTDTRIDRIDLGGGIDFFVKLGLPRVDLHPDTFGFALPPGPNQFSIEIKAALGLLCRSRRDPNDDNPRGEPLITELAVCATGHIERNGNFLSLVIDNVEIKDIHPESLESIIECILRLVLNDALADLRIPYRNVFIGLGTISPVGAPSIKEDQVNASADLI